LLILSLLQLSELDPDELEDAFVIERDSEGPDSTGSFTGPAVMNNMPSDLTSQLKGVVKILQKRDPSCDAGKEGRQRIINNTLSNLIETLITAYPTSIEDDEALLLDPSISKRSRLAVEIRIGEKKLLMEARATLNAVQSRPSNGDGDGERPSKKQRV
jgi:hypothetical protein